jgi:hypothetical protein
MPRLEQVNLAAHQVRDKRLSYTKELGGLRLANFSTGKVIFQRRQQDGTQLYVFCLFRGVLDGILDTGKSLLAHWLSVVWFLSVLHLVDQVVAR